HDANVIFGAVIDESMGDALSITVIATGFGKAEAKAKPVEAAPRPAAARIYEIEPRERLPRPMTVARELEEEEPEPATAPAVPAAKSAFRMSPGTARRPFGGRVLTRDNMDVPAFMRKQMD